MASLYEMDSRRQRIELEEPYGQSVYIHLHMLE